MMLNSAFRHILMMAMMILIVPGCGYFQRAEIEDTDEMSELDGDKKPEKSDADDEVAGKVAPTEAELELKLKVGDRFPLRKVIDQRLTQFDGQGTSVNRSVVDMVLSLRVDEIRDGRRLLTVQYHRIHYGHNIAGKRVEYNSDSNDRVPAEAMVYAGLKDNGFSFWIGPDNRVSELVGFGDFLQRCLRNVPPQYRETVMRQLENTANSDEGLANFVDDGIGLLPYSNDPRRPGVDVKEGSMWDLKPRRTEGPAQMNIMTRCVVKKLTDTSAEISLAGTISGSNAPISVPDGNRSMQVFIKGGYCAGSCTVDRHTGLPTQSQVNRSLEMTVKMPDGSEINQRKEILTSIASFIESPGGSIEIGSNRVTPASGTQSQPDRRGDSQAFGMSNGRSGTR